jgi:signal transduction histidine kinase
LKGTINDKHSGIPVPKVQKDEPVSRQELEREQMAAIGTAAALLTHQIKNPLNGISTTIQLLDRTLRKGTQPTVESLTSAVQDLQNEIEQLQALLRDFENISHPPQLNIQPVDLAQLARDSAAAVETECKKNRVEVTVECGSDLHLQGDPERLKVAFVHLVSNGCQAMPSGGRLTIRCYRCGPDVCVDVADSGQVIPCDLKILDLFTSAKSGATGLGLVMVQQIVLAHEGSMTYSSTEGKGTTFTVRLPA